MALQTSWSVDANHDLTLTASDTTTKVISGQEAFELYACLEFQAMRAGWFGKQGDGTSQSNLEDLIDDFVDWKVAQ